MKPLPVFVVLGVWEREGRKILSIHTSRSAAEKARQELERQPGESLFSYYDVERHELTVDKLACSRGHACPECGGVDIRDDGYFGDYPWLACAACDHHFLGREDFER